MKETHQIISDSELENNIIFWLEHYLGNGDKHHIDTPDWKFKELYYDMIVNRIFEDIPEVTSEQEEEIIDRINNIF